MTTEEKDYVNKLIMSALTVNTDEIEGQQVIDLNNMNLCSVDQDFSYADADTDDYEEEMQKYIDIANDEDIKKILEADPEDLPDVIKDLKTDIRTIIEFADATLKDPKPVNYKITVKPGQEINNETVLGYVEQEGKMKEIKSIFEKATVMSVNDGNDFFQLYPSSCNRHIVLTDCVSGEGTTIDIKELENLNDAFKSEGYLFQLITNNLAQSLLPYILSHRIRGVYTRKKILLTYTKYEIEDGNNDLEMEIDGEKTITYDYVNDKNYKGGKRIDNVAVVTDEINENADNGIIIYDTSVLKVLDELQDQFGADIIGCDITKANIKSWKKRAKKKKNRKKVKKEINDKVEKGTNKFKVDNPLPVLEEEKDRLLKARSSYIDDIIKLYEERESFPLCKFDSDYNDCKCLVSDTDKDILKQTKKVDDEFTYTAVGDAEEYYNYYISLLANVNIMNDDDKYSKEYYELLKDIIDKRLIVEKCDVKTLQLDFCKLYNENITKLFDISSDDKKNTETKVANEFNKLSQNITTYSSQNKYEDLTLYMQTYQYIKSQKSVTEDDEEGDDLAVTQLATMYEYIKTYGKGENNKYKDMKTEDDKYLYYKLVIEESNKLIEFWDRMIDLYRKECNMDTCINNLYSIAYSFDNVAQWPSYSEIIIDDIHYKHYLFENIYTKEYDPVNDDIVIGDYDFPETVDFPDIPDELPDIDQQWALDELNNFDDLMEPDNPNVISIKDFKYWQKYFSLATLICLPPCFWNCGLDILPFIQLIPLPCIFIAISSVYIKLFGIIMVFGIAIRGMYPWPIILYVNTTNQPISIMTPLLVVLQQLKDIMNKKLQDLEEISVKGIVQVLIKQLENDSNNIKKENKKLDAFIQVCKNAPLQKAESLKRKFNSIVDPSIDNRQRIQRMETLIKQGRVE